MQTLFRHLPRPKVETMDPNEAKVFLGNLPDNLSVERLEQILKQFGQVRVAKIFPSKRGAGAGSTNWGLAEFQEHKQAEKCIRNYGIISEAVGDLVNVRWFRQRSEGNSPTKEDNRCIDPGCGQVNNSTSENCSKCNINLSIFTPKASEQRRDLLLELENATSDTVRKNPNVLKAFLKNKVGELETECKMIQNKLKKVEKQDIKVGSFDDDLDRIITLRKALIDKKIPAKVVKRHDEKDNLPIVVKHFKELLVDEAIDNLTNNVREAFDFYDICKKRFEQASKNVMKPAIQQSLNGAAMGLHLALMDYLEDYPVEKHRNILMLISQAFRFYETTGEETFETKDLEKEIDKILSAMPSEDTPSVDVHDSLRSLSGALTCIASVITPENDLARFEGGLPKVQKAAKQAIKDMETALGKEPDIASTLDRPYIFKVLNSIKSEVETNMKKYKLNFLLCEELSEEQKYDFNLKLPGWFNDLSNKPKKKAVATGAQAQALVKGDGSGKISSNSSSRVATPTNDLERDNLSDVILPGDDDITTVYKEKD